MLIRQVSRNTLLANGQETKDQRYRRFCRLFLSIAGAVRLEVCVCNTPRVIYNSTVMLAACDILGDDDKGFGEFWLCEVENVWGCVKKLDG